MVVAADAVSTVFSGSKGADPLRNRDVYYGGIDSDIVFGGDGPDKLFGDPPGAVGGFDFLVGGAGNDTLHPGSGGGDGENLWDNVAWGGGGDDLFYGGPGHDVLGSTLGVDTFFGGDGNDAIFGGEGNDRLFGEGGNDWLFGEGGDDVVVGGSGEDQISGGDDDIFLVEDEPLVVTTLVDEENAADSALSLREAVAQANASPGFDLIQFSPALAETFEVGQVVDTTLMLGQLQLGQEPLAIFGLPNQRVRLDAAFQTEGISVSAGTRFRMDQFEVVNTVDAAGNYWVDFARQVPLLTVSLVGGEQRTRQASVDVFRRLGLAPFSSMNLGRSGGTPKNRLYVKDEARNAVYTLSCSPEWVLDLTGGLFSVIGNAATRPLPPGVRGDAIPPGEEPLVHPVRVPIWMDDGVVVRQDENGALFVNGDPLKNDTETGLQPIGLRDIPGVALRGVEIVERDAGRTLKMTLENGSGGGLGETLLVLQAGIWVVPSLAPAEIHLDGIDDEPLTYRVPLNVPVDLTTDKISFGRARVQVNGVTMPVPGRENEGRAILRLAFSAEEFSLNDFVEVRVVDESGNAVVGMKSVRFLIR